MRKRHDSQPEVGVHLDLSYAFYRPDPFCNSLAFVVPRREEHHREPLLLVLWHRLDRCSHLRREFEIGEKVVCAFDEIDLSDEPEIMGFVSRFVE